MIGERKWGVGPPLTSDIVSISHPATNHYLQNISHGMIGICYSLDHTEVESHGCIEESS